MPSNTNQGDEIARAAERTANYLYSLPKDCSPELAQTISTLRQLTNEEFVHKNRSISSQQIYDILYPKLTEMLLAARIDEIIMAKQFVGNPLHKKLLEDRIAELESQKTNGKQL